MNNSSTLIKGIILPMIIKLSKGNLNDLPDDFWNQFANDFIHYEIDAQPVYSTLYKLELQNPEEVFEKLPQAYSSFISELAEEYVLGNTSTIINKLLESKNDLFLKEVTFLKTMKSVITKLERQKLKESLPHLHDRLVFELDEEILKQVAKKKAREDLKNKFKQWDKELVEKEANSELIKYFIAGESNSSFETEESVNSTNSERKVISLSWIKYAAAACIVLTAGIMFFKFNSDNDIVQPVEKNVVTTPAKEKTTTYEIPMEDLADIKVITKITPVIESGLGFASNSNNIKIVEYNQKARISSIVTTIEKYRKLLEKEFSENKVGVGSRVKVLETIICELQNELALLKEREKQYIFDGKTLKLYILTAAKENYIILYNESYYLKRNADFYLINSSNKINENLLKITNVDMIEILKELIIENN